MTNEQTGSEHGSPLESVRVSLVDGNADVRHARQIMLRSENYDVRSYATCAALLADPRSRDFPCIVVDVEMDTGTGVTLLREMRATGWRGKAILLDGANPGSDLLEDVERYGDRILDRAIGDRSLVVAIEAAVDRGWSGWSAAG